MEISREQLSELFAKEAKRFDEGFAAGVTVACSIIQETFDQPTVVVEVLRCCGLDNLDKLKESCPSDHDYEILSGLLLKDAA